MAILVAVLVGVHGARALPGRVNLGGPQPGSEFQPGDVLTVYGNVIQSDGTPFPNATLLLSLLDAQFSVVPGTLQSNLSGDPTGSFLFSLELGTSLPGGQYLVRVASPNASIAAAEVSILVRVPVPPSALEASFLGLPAWVWLVVLIGSAALIGGGTAYAKFSLQDRPVVCASCGRTTLASTPKCPSCGAEMPRPRRGLRPRG